MTRATTQLFSPCFSQECCQSYSSPADLLPRGRGSNITIQMGIGQPASELYPWESLGTPDIKFVEGIATSVQPNKVDKLDHPASVGRCQGYRLSEALEYSSHTGSFDLIRYLTDFTDYIHKPQYGQWKLSLSCGSTSAIALVLRMLCNRGDTILSEEYSYTGFLKSAGLLGLSIKSIDMDDEGICPDHLDDVLSDWNTSCHGAKPQVLYTIPSGQNPTGITQSPARKAAVYKVAVKHKLMIIEDDAYYYIKLDPNLQPHEMRRKAGECRNYPASYLSMDQFGLVVRLDSFSKILAPGLRIGWITAQEPLTQRFVHYQGIVEGAVNGTSQLVLHDLLLQNWGLGGFLTWLQNLSSRYNTRLRGLLKACQRHLPPELCTWRVPQHGMFLWLKVDMSRVLHEDANCKQSTIAQRIEANLVTRMASCGVQIVGGAYFMPPEQERPAAVNVRLTYATADAIQFDDAMLKLAMILRETITCAEN